eukprot:c22461_g1_i1 orf=429-1511(-)
MSAELHPSGEVSELYSPWQRHSHNEVWKEFVWGGLAAAFGESMMHPIDTVKTRMQSGGKFINSFQRSTRFNEVLKLVLKNDGPRGLYRGITPGMTGSLATGATYFGFIEMTKQWMQARHPNLSGPVVDFWAGALGDTLGSIVYVPCEVIKQRMQVQGTQSMWNSCTTGKGASTFKPEYQYYKGLLHAARSIIRQEGYTGLYTGYGPTLARDVPFAGLLIVFYELLSNWAQEMRPHERPSNVEEFALSGFEDLVMGGVAGGMSAYLTTPFDVIKTRLQIQGSTRRYKGWRDAFQTISKDEGISGFFKGSVPRCMWYVPAYALTFMAWQALRNFSEPAATPMGSMPKYTSPQGVTDVAPQSS